MRTSVDHDHLRFSIRSSSGRVARRGLGLGFGERRYLEDGDGAADLVADRQQGRPGRAIGGSDELDTFRCPVAGAAGIVVLRVGLGIGCHVVELDREIPVDDRLDAFGSCGRRHVVDEYARAALDADEREGPISDPTEFDRFGLGPLSVEFWSPAGNCSA